MTVNLPHSLLDALKHLLGEHFSTAQAVREHHGRDESLDLMNPGKIFRRKVGQSPTVAQA